MKPQISKERKITDEPLTPHTKDNVLFFKMFIWPCESYWVFSCN